MLKTTVLWQMLHPQLTKIHLWKHLRNKVNTRYRMWHLLRMTLPVFIGALGIISKGSNRDQVPCSSKICELKIILFIGNFHILLRFFSKKWPQLHYYFSLCLHGTLLSLDVSGCDMLATCIIQSKSIIINLKKIQK